MILVRKGVIASSYNVQGGGEPTDPWNISTASFAELDTGSTFDPPYSGIVSGRMRPEGTKLFILTDTDITHINFENEYDFSNIQGAPFSFDLSSQDNQNVAFSVNSNGTKLYTLGRQNNNVYSYTFGSAWSVNTLTYDSLSSSVGGPLDGAPARDIFVDSNEQYVFIMGGSAVYGFEMSSPGNVSTLGFRSGQFFNTTEDPGDVFTCMWFKTDGTKMYIGATRAESSSHIYQYELTTAWDITTASLEESYDVPTSSYRLTNSMFINPDTGTDMVLWQADSTGAGDTVFEYYSIGGGSGGGSNPGF